MASLFGRPDWQRVTSTDSVTIVNNQTVARTGSVGIGRFNVAGYDFLRGLIFANVVSFVTLDWYTAPVGGIFAGRRSFAIDPSMGNCVLSIPNLGPFVQISYGSIGGGVNWQETTQLMATNRPAPLPFEPGLVNLIATNGDAVGAGATSTIWPRGYYAGRAHLWALADQTYSVDIWAYDNTATLLRVESFRGLAALADLHQDIIVPGCAWQVRVTNTSGAAASLSLAVTPSLTGSG